MEELAELIPLAIISMDPPRHEVRDIESISQIRFHSEFLLVLGLAARRRPIRSPIMQSLRTILDVWCSAPNC
jgi:hypothetical protein